MYKRLLVVSIVCIVVSTLIEAQGAPGMRAFRRQISDKVCSGKATEAQLNAVTKCEEDFQKNVKDQTLNVDFDKIMDDCIKESGTDLGFAVSESNKRAVYMICSSKVHKCIHHKIPSPSPPQSTDNEVLRGRGLSPEIRAKFTELMECKKKALELN